MKRLILTLLAVAAVAAPAATLAKGPDRQEDRWDRREDRIDRREDYWDRANREWWRGRAEFKGYVGVRPGYAFAPGYGYYRLAPVYYGRRWGRGTYLPLELRRYRVVDPGFYRLSPPPRGYGWVYVGNDIVLIALATGLVTDIVMDVW